MFTYRELRDTVARFAGALAAQGVGHGDRVIVYMPMVPEALVAMLACARIGAVHSVVFGGFAANELATRIDDAQPKVVVSASCGIEPGRIVEYKPLLDAAIAAIALEAGSLHRPPASRCSRPTSTRHAIWTGTRHSRAPSQSDCVPLAATDPLYIIYTSGTTGQPKGIVRDNGGHAVALAWSMKNIYDTDPGEVYWAASDIGWTVGHSYTVYGPLLHGCTSVLYEGKPVGTPDPGAFWRVCAEHGVSTLFTAPTAFRAIRQQDPDGEHIGRYDLSKLRALFLAGERCDPETLRWAEDKLRIPVIDHYWQTETGWPVAANCIGIERLPVIPGSPTRAVPGWDLHVLDEAGAERPPGEIGALVVKLPMPPGSSPTLWNAEERYRETYLTTFPGYYQTADAGYLDDEGYVFVMARTDDIINVAGHRLSTGRWRRCWRTPGRRRVRRHRRRGRPERPASRRLSRPESGRGAAARRDRGRGRALGAREDRPGRGVQDRGRRRAAAEDALGKDPARDDATDRRRGAVHDPCDDRRTDAPRRRVRSASDDRVFEGAGLERLKTVGSSQLVSSRASSSPGRRSSVRARSSACSTDRRQRGRVWAGDYGTSQSSRCGVESHSIPSAVTTTSSSSPM